MTTQTPTTDRANLHLAIAADAAVRATQATLETKYTIYLATRTDLARAEWQAAGQVADTVRGQVATALLLAQAGY